MLSIAHPLRLQLTVDDHPEDAEHCSPVTTAAHSGSYILNMIYMIVIVFNSYIY